MFILLISLNKKQNTKRNYVCQHFNYTSLVCKNEDIGRLTFCPFLMSYSNLRSKLDRAICAWLVNQGCGSVDDINPFAQTKLTPYPNTEVHSTLSKPDPDFSGNRRVSVQISIKGSATKDPANPDSQNPRIQFDKRVAATADALMQTDDNGVSLNATARSITTAGRALAAVQDPTDPVAVQFAADNSDMADFTCQMWIDDGEGDGEITADEDGCAWNEVFMFVALANPSNTD